MASIVVTATGTTLNWLGATRQVVATPRSATGAPLSGVTLSWSSSRPDVASVSASGGMVTAASPGTATITASAGAVSGSISITVQQLPGAVTVAPGLDTLLAPGQSRSFTATVRDTGGTVIPGASVRWSSSSDAVAEVDSLSGAALATGPGTVALTARAGTVTGSATLVVRNGELVGSRVLLTDFGNTTDNDYLIDDYFVVWWHASQDYAADAQQILDWLKVVKTQSLQLGLRHPPTDARGTYLNIYIHEPGPGNDNYPDDWGAGVGTDSNGLPFLTLGSNVRGDPLFIRHEGFHLYQYTRSSPGFAYEGDGAWFTEATANWFAGLDYPTDVGTYIAAGTVPANPQLALWHAFTNGAPGDPPNWNRQVRQYGLNTWLHYLTTTGGAPVSVLVDGYNAGTSQLPQEYLHGRVPGLGAIFADWAAQNTADMAYLTRPQWDRALLELANVGDPADINPTVLHLVDVGTAGAFVQPPAGLLPRGWAYNVIRASSTQAATWRFTLDGAPTGSGGAPAAFEARLLIRAAAGDTVRTVTLTGGLDGTVSTTTGGAAAELYLIVAAVPMHFTGNQTYPYQVKVDRVP